MRVFAFVLRQKADFPVKTLCQVCNVSTSGYYDWAARELAGPTEAQIAEAELLVQIRLVHKASRGRYGAPRVTAQLARDGVVVNHKRVERLMAEEGLQGRSARRRMRTTVSDPGAALSPDLVERQFGQSELDLLWLGDVTYVPTDEGWLYLANILDACSRRAIGWSIADHLRTELCLDALHAAVGTRGGAANVVGVIFHSDHGCQGGINWSSQHLDEEVARWPTGSGRSRCARIGGRSHHRDGRRWPGVRIGSGSGMRSPAA